MPGSIALPITFRFNSGNEIGMICLWKFLSDKIKQTHRFLGGASVLVVYLLRLPCDYIAGVSFIAAWAAARRAMGTRKGEQET